MTLRLTPPILQAAYDFLRSTPPFNRWKLPESDDIEFRVAHSKTWCGLFDSGKDGGPRISISSRLVGDTDHLIEVMAHEMVHVHQDHRGQQDSGEHGAGFHRLAALVCRHHGFDRKRF